MKHMRLLFIVCLLATLTNCYASAGFERRSGHAHHYRDHDRR